VKGTAFMEKLDCLGMRCPMPIVRLSMAMKPLEPGALIEVSADDPVFRPDIEAWARKTGHSIESFETTDGIVTAVVRKAVQ
jgi:tRNA 2-thiouridine synthesizing protein A